MKFKNLSLRLLSKDIHGIVLFFHMVLFSYRLLKIEIVTLKNKIEQKKYILFQIFKFKDSAN